MSRVVPAEGGPPPASQEGGKGCLLLGQRKVAPLSSCGWVGRSTPGLSSTGRREARGSQNIKP